MYETLRMLAQDHEADLERQAAKRQRTAAARAARGSRPVRRGAHRTWAVLRSRFAALVR